MRDLVIRGGRVFDGHRLRGPGTVVVRGTRIAALLGQGEPEQWPRGAEVVEAGGRCQLGCVVVVAHGGQQPSHLGERRTPRLLDVAQGLAIVGRGLRQPVPHGPHLEHDDADRVGDDVVQLASDPAALLRHGDAGGGLPLELGEPCALFPFSLGHRFLPVRPDR